MHFSSIDTLLKDLEAQLRQSLQALKHDLASFRTGKASPSLVEDIIVDYYGSQTRLRDLAVISIPEVRLIQIQPWDQQTLSDIEKALQNAELGIHPVSDGRILRLAIPPLSEERRKELGRQIRKRAEDAKVELRNHRREANDLIKRSQQNGDITKDQQHDLLQNTQKQIDHYIGKIDMMSTKKEADIMDINL